MAPKITKRIMDMKIGEIGYTLPWSLDCEHIISHDLTLNLVIRGDYSVSDCPEEESRMKIQRNEDGIIIFGNSVSEYEFAFSGDQMMLAWHPIKVTWVDTVN